MKRASLAIFGSLLVSTLAFAQEPIVPVPAEPVSGGWVDNGGGAAHCGNLYGRAEYLLWWMTKAPNPVPLLTTGNPLVDPTAGVLGSPTTRTLFGGRDVDLGSFSGGRFTVGWAGADSPAGVEGSIFFLAERDKMYNNASNNNGDPFLAIPFRSLGGPESAFLLANNGLAANLVRPDLGIGRFSASNTSRLWGTELNAVFNATRGDSVRVDLLAGFVYRQLEEDLTLIYALAAPVIVPGAGTFAGTSVDHFSTANRFYGGQVGARVGWCFGGVSVEATGKIAVGNNHETVSIGGNGTFQSSGAFAPLFPSGNNNFGVFAQRSNIGTRHRDEFEAIPEVGLQIGYNVTNNIKVFAGYNVMYWSDVARPGTQVDRTINSIGSVAPRGADFFTGLQSDVPSMGGRPSPLINQSELWVQGVSAGVEFRW